MVRKFSVLVTIWLLSLLAGSVSAQVTVDDSDDLSSSSMQMIYNLKPLERSIAHDSIQLLAAAQHPYVGRSLEMKTAANQSEFIVRVMDGQTATCAIMFSQSNGYQPQVVGRSTSINAVSKVPFSFKPAEYSELYKAALGSPPVSQT